MNLNSLMNQLSTSTNSQPMAQSTDFSFAKGAVGGVAGGALASLLMNKKGRKHLGTAAKVGGLAALGGLAWKAYQGYQSQPPTQEQHTAYADQDAPSRSDFEFDTSTTYGRERNRILIRAMIAAAYADGKITPEEQQAIFRETADRVMSRDERSMVLTELEQPRKLQDIVSRVDDIETAIEVYLISAIVIDQDCLRGRSYLNAMALVLDLPDAMIQQLHQQAGYRSAKRIAENGVESSAKHSSAA